MRKLFCIVCMILSCVATLGAQEKGASRDLVSDAQCVIVGARWAGSANTAQRNSAILLMIYYLGRMDGRSSGASMGKAIQSEARVMTTSEFQNAARRCGAELATKGKEIEQIGKDLGQLTK